MEHVILRTIVQSCLENEKKKGRCKTWENVFVRVNLLQAPQIFAVTLCNTLIYLLHTAGPSIIKAGYATGKKHKIATRS